MLPVRVASVLFACLMLAPLTARADADQAVPIPADAATKPSERPVYGPIRSNDPMVRAEIKHLYLEMEDLRQATLATLAEINAKLQTERDPDFRFELSRKAGEAKRMQEIRHCELGLQIARLNKDLPRVAELELALDQMLHPEKYLNRQRPDASVERAAVERAGAGQAGQ